MFVCTCFVGLCVFVSVGLFVSRAYLVLCMFVCEYVLVCGVCACVVCVCGYVCLCFSLLGVCVWCV